MRVGVAEEVEYLPICQHTVQRRSILIILILVLEHRSKQRHDHPRVVGLELLSAGFELLLAGAGSGAALHTEHMCRLLEQTTQQ